MLFRAIIIDNEPPIRSDLCYMLSKHPEIKVIGETGSIDEAAILLSRLFFDVVFLDIELCEGSDFDLISRIPLSTHTIFFTAYNDYAVRAFEINALDYLLKPVTEDRLAVSIKRLKDRHKIRIPYPGLRHPFRLNNQIFIKTENSQRVVLLDSIAAITSVGGNYTALYLEESKKYIVRRALKEWEAILPPSLFFRVHRSTIVNLKQINLLAKDKNGTCQVQTACLPQLFEVSRRIMPKLKKRIDNIA